MMKDISVLNFLIHKPNNRITLNPMQGFLPNAR